MPTTAGKIGRNAFSTVFSATLGIVTSIILDAIVIGFFGMSWQTDAFFIATTIPSVIGMVMVLLTTRVIQPILINKQHTQGEAAGWNYVNLLVTSGTVLVAMLTIIGVLISPLLVRIQAVGAEAPMLSLSMHLSVLMFLILPFYVPISIMRIALNSLGSFALPGAMKFFENIPKIASVILLGKSLGVMSLVVGTIAGVVCQLACCYLALRAKGYRLKFLLNLFHEDLLKSCRLMLFPMAGQLATVGVELINNALGSMLGVGNVSALRLATRIIDCFSGLLGGSIVFAAMPAISTSVSKGDRAAAKGDVRQALYLLLLVTLPLSAWLALMNKPLIAFIYERMSFSSADTALVSSVLLVMVPYIFLSRLMGLLELPFFAEHDTRTPLLGSIMQAVLYVVISVPLVFSLGIYALPAGRSLSFLAACILLVYLLRRRWGNLGVTGLKTSLSKVFWSTCVMGGITAIGLWLVQLIADHGFLSKVAALSIPTMVGGLSLVAMLLRLGIVKKEHLQRFLDPIRRLRPQ